MTTVHTDLERKFDPHEMFELRAGDPELSLSGLP